MKWKGLIDSPWSLYMKTLMLNISVKFHSDIPYRKGTIDHKLFSDKSREDNS